MCYMQQHATTFDTTNTRHRQKQPQLLPHMLQTHRVATAGIFCHGNIASTCQIALCSSTAAHQQWFLCQFRMLQHTPDRNSMCRAGLRKLTQRVSIDADPSRHTYLGWLWVACTLPGDQVGDVPYLCRHRWAWPEEPLQEGLELSCSLQITSAASKYCKELCMIAAVADAQSLALTVGNDEAAAAAHARLLLSGSLQDM